MQGANIHHADEKKHTLLHEAARHGHVDIVRFLLACGVHVDATDDNGTTALHFARFSLLLKIQTIDIEVFHIYSDFSTQFRVRHSVESSTIVRVHFRL